MRYEIVEWPGEFLYPNSGGKYTHYSLFDRHEDKHVFYHQDLQEVKNRKEVLEGVGLLVARMRRKNNA